MAASGLTAQAERLHWLDPVRGIGLVLIFLNHALERMGELPLVANPDANWPPLQDRVSQLLTPAGGSWWDAAFNVIRYPGLLGEVGVQLFVIASGLGLTLSALRRGSSGRGFLRRRARRIVPTWAVVHLLALAASVPVLLFGGRFAEHAAAVWDIRFWASLVGFRVIPSTFYYLVPAWWFITLLLQLYLIFPLLFRLLERWGSRRYWLVVAGAIGAKLAGLLTFGGYLDEWSRGAIFVTRLPEFAFGMLVAVWLTQERNPLRTGLALTLAVLAVPLGVASSLTLIGNAWGPFAFGAGLFMLLHRWLGSHRPGSPFGGAGWVGRHSLSLFVVHQPIIIFILPAVVAGPVRVLGGLLAAVVMTVIAGITLEWVVSRAEHLWRQWRQRGIAVQRVAAGVAAALVLYWGLVGADVWVRTHDPQEVLGWGERPSLQADETLGWRLIPNQTTRLRWQSYDYEVTSNGLGFPGPAVVPGPLDLRILALGDAFTSAEGVDTDAAWPRLLEAHLGRPATVWNGAVTGYGPNQYAAVAAELAPLLDPDVVVVGFFVNDFLEAATDIQDAQEGIGFGQPDPTGPVPSLEWKHLSSWLSYNVTQPALALIGVPNSRGYFFANFEALEPGRINHDAYQSALEAMQTLRTAVPRARLIMMLVPASVQVCDPAALGYYPSNLDPAEFDFEQPQRLAFALAAEIGAEVLDLRPPLAAAAECPYQPANMHWLEEGHQIAAAALIRYLVSSPPA